MGNSGYYEPSLQIEKRLILWPLMVVTCVVCVVFSLLCQMC